MKKRKKGRRPPAKRTGNRKTRHPAPKPAAASPAAAFVPPLAAGRGDALTQATTALDAGRPADAVRLLRGAVMAAPDDADALNLLAVATFQAGDANEARDLLETAIAFRPGFADALNNLGNVLKATGELADAEAAYRRALRARPGYVDAAFNLGIALEAQGRFTDAADCYRDCLKIDSGFAPAHFNLGNALKALGRLEEALRSYRAALKHAPGDAQALNNLGTVLAELGRGPEAVDAYRRAVGAQANLADAHYNLGIALQEQRAHADAIESYRRALAADPAHAGAQINIGYALKELDRLDDAAVAYEKAIAMAPDYDKVRVNLGDLYLEKGRPEAALKVCDDYLVDRPGNVSMLAFKAIVLTELGRDDETAELYDFDRLLRPVTLTAPDGFADMDAFNAALTEHVLGHPSLTRAPASHATRNGRHSGELLAEPKGPVAALERAIMEAVEGYRAAVPVDPSHPYLRARPDGLGLTVWGVAMDAQGHQVAHIHPSAWLSGVYYPKLPAAISAGDGTHAGWIEFGRAPEDFHATKAPKVKLIKPEEGLMLLFPSYFYHRTVPFAAAETRISIAFDVLARD